MSFNRGGNGDCFLCMIDRYIDFSLSFLSSLNFKDDKCSSSVLEARAALDADGKRSVSDFFGDAVAFSACPKESCDGIDSSGFVSNDA